MLRAKDFFAGDREKRSGFDGRVVGDDHAQPLVNSADAGDDSGGGCTGVLLVHAERRPKGQLEKLGAGIEQLRDPLTSRQPALGALGVGGFRTSAQADGRLLRREFREQGLYRRRVRSSFRRRLGPANNLILKGRFAHADSLFPSTIPLSLRYATF